MSATAPYLHDNIAVLAPFVEARVLDASAVHVAEVIGRASGAVDLEVLLGAALAVACLVAFAVGQRNQVNSGTGPFPVTRRWSPGCPL